jgi:hypothetical protein
MEESTLIERRENVNVCMCVYELFAAFLPFGCKFGYDFAEFGTNNHNAMPLRSTFTKDSANRKRERECVCV